jgi:meiotically up-regulated gene 157 (Mug157) protein
MSLTRRTLLRGAMSAGAVAASRSRFAVAAAALTASDAPTARPPLGERRFVSPAVESAIERVSRQISDTELALIFANCLPNTLDTTVSPGIFDGKPDTFVITGDIDAMWLRDSSAQVWPYLPFCREDARLATLIEGVIRRQTRCILIDPYANAFLPDTTGAQLPWSVHDDTTMKPGVAERKWEIDSLCYPVRLAHGYWRATGNTAPFDAQWRDAARAIVRTFREQQRKHGQGPYHFQRSSPQSTETLPLDGYGNPARSVGLIYSGFRPSDDACIYPLFIPANLFAVAALRQLADLAGKVCNDAALANECAGLADEVATAAARYGQIDTVEHGRIWAYEVDGYGNSLRMDDANAPGLLALGYLGCVAPSERALYERTRAFALSDSNPYFFRGSAAEGIGGPHEGLGYIWPMSIMFRAFSSTSDQEILQCLRWLRDTTAGTHFMHESFWKDDPMRYTRPWFAWANTLFGELILKLAEQRQSLLRTSLLETSFTS